MAKVIRLPKTKKQLTVEPAVEAFMDRDWSPNTRRNFQSDLKRFLKTFSDRPVETITPKDLQRYLNRLKTNQGAPVAPQTYNRHFGTLNNLFGWLEQQEEIERNPMDKVDRRKLPERLPRPMTSDQLKRFFQRIDESRDKVLFSLLYGSGLRVSEALALDIEDLDLRRGRFVIIGKGDVERVGYLSEETTKLIRRYLRERSRPKQGPLFESRQGRLSYAMTSRLFRRYAEGIETNGNPLTIHQLRHTFGSERAGNMDVLILRDLMGHKSLRTTQQYAQVNGKAVEKAFREFDRERQEG